MMVPAASNGAVILRGELTELDGQNGLIVVRIGDKGLAPAEHRVTGLTRDRLKALAGSLYEPVEIVIRPVKAEG